MSRLIRTYNTIIDGGGAIQPINSGYIIFDGANGSYARTSNGYPNGFFSTLDSRGTTTSVGIFFSLSSFDTSTTQCLWSVGANLQYYARVRELGTNIRFEAYGNNRNSIMSMPLANFEFGAWYLHITTKDVQDPGPGRGVIKQGLYKQGATDWDLVLSNSGSYGDFASQSSSADRRVYFASYRGANQFFNGGIAYFNAMWNDDYMNSLSRITSGNQIDETPASSRGLFHVPFNSAPVIQDVASSSRTSIALGNYVLVNP